MTITNDLAVFAGGANSNTIFANGGKIGIGTTSPGFKLEVVGGTNDGLHIKDAASATVYGGLFTQSSQLALITRSNHHLAFGTNDSIRAVIYSNGQFATSTNRAISAASVPAGSVLQVAQTTWAAGAAYTAQSASNIDFTGFSATFTPLYNTSKVLIQLFAGVNGICDLNVYIKRNGTIIENSWFGSSRQDDQYDYPYVGAVLLDSPATTSTITYQIGGRATGCANYIRFGGSDSGSRIVFMEIAG
jgi:hypothetical protein